MSNTSKRTLLSWIVAVSLGLICTGVFLITSAHASPAPACTDTWTAASGGDWGTAASWSLNRAPDSTDVACWASDISLEVGALDIAATAGSVQGGSLDIDGTPLTEGSLTLATSGSTSNLVNLDVGVGHLQGPGALALTGNFAFTGVDPGSYPDELTQPMLGYPTTMAISQSGGGSFQLGQSDCVTSYVDGTFTTTSPVDIGCSYMLPEGGSLTTTSNLTFVPGAYPSAAGSRMNVTAQGYVISGSTEPQDWNLVQDGGTTTIPTGDNFTPGIGLTLDSGNIVLDGPDPQFSLGPGTLSNGLIMNGGTLSGIGLAEGEVNNDGGTVSPGLSGTGDLSILAYVQAAGGTLQVTTSGTAAADYDAIKVTGAAQLAGTLEMIPAGGYADSAAAGDSLDVVQTGFAVTGAFTTVTSDPALANDETFTADYGTADQVNAVVTAPASTAPPTTTVPTTSTPTSSTPTPSTPAPTTSTPTVSSPTQSTQTQTQTTPPVNVAGPAFSTPAPTGSAAVQGTPLPGDTLTCDPGTWTGSPSFSYQWVRGSSPISGATSATYTVTILDEGSTITCAVSAHNSAGTAGAVAAGVAVAQKGTLTCPRPAGAFAAQRIGPFTLGETRSRARKSFHHWQVIQSGFDNFCLYGGWGIRGAYRANQFVLLDTANPYYKLKGISPGDTLKALAAKLKIGQAIVIGRNDWYVAAGTTSNYVFKARGGIVEEIGIANRRDSTGRAVQKRFLSSFKAD